MHKPAPTPLPEPTVPFLGTQGRVANVSPCGVGPAPASAGNVFATAGGRTSAGGAFPVRDPIYS